MVADYVIPPPPQAVAVAPTLVTKFHLDRAARTPRRR
jgi:hypothetical protein